MTFTNDFSAGVPAEISLYGNAYVTGGSLVLSSNLPAQRSTVVLDNIPFNRTVQSFTVNFKAALFGGSAPPADGFSFNLVPSGAIPFPATNWVQEDGLSNGLALTFDTYDNGGGEAPAVELRWNGTVIARTNFQASASPTATNFTGAVRNVSITLTSNGVVNVLYGSNALFTNVATPYQPFNNPRWVFGARTGGLTDNVFIDDLSISAVLAPQPQYIEGQLISGPNGLPNIPVRATLLPLTENNFTPGFAIPDLGTLTRSNSFVATNRIGYVAVSVDIVHSYAGDLRITLISPQGTQVVLRDADYNDDSEDVSESYDLTTTPALSAITNQAMNGAWQLKVQDIFAGDSGLLRSWSLTLGPSPVLTDSNGVYFFTGLYPTNYTVQPARDGLLFDPPQDFAFTGSSNVNFYLDSGFFSGRVTSSGAGLAGVMIQVPGKTATTDSSGYYTISGVNSATTASASLAGYSFAPTNQAAAIGQTNVNFTVSGFPVSGRIIDALTNGISGVTVTAGAITATTDANGFYQLAGIAPGSRVIVPVRSGYQFNPTNRIVSVSNALSGIDFNIVQSPPTITDVKDRVVPLGSANVVFRCTVNDAETRAGKLVLAASSSNPSLIPVANILLDGVGADRTATITPVAGRLGIATITLTVTDEDGESASDSFAVRVNSSPVAGMGSALAFDGFSSTVQFTNAIVPDKGSFTVETWLSAVMNSAARVLFSQGSGARRFLIGVATDGNLRVANDWNTGVPLPFGGWHHVAVVKNATNTLVYLDGALAAARGSSTTNPTLSAAVLGNNSWLGQAEELRAWNYAQSQSEIQTNMHRRLTGREPGLVSLWHFDEASGTNTFAAFSGARATLTNVSWPMSGVAFDRYLLSEDFVVEDFLQAFDADGDELQFNVTTPPAHGSLSIIDTNTGAFRFVPDSNFNGSDAFSFTASDGYAEMPVFTMNISVLADTNAPTITPPPFTTSGEDMIVGPLAFTISDAEVDASNLVVTASSSNTNAAPNFGILLGGSGSNRTVTIYPATNQPAGGAPTASTIITLTVSDGKLSTSGQFILSLTNVNDAPTISLGANQIVTPRGTLKFVDVTMGDVEGGPFTLTLASSNPSLLPTNNIVIQTLTSFIRRLNMTPVAGLSGQSIITVTVSDGKLSASTNLTVIVNDPPTIAVIPNQTTYRSQSSSPITITIGDTENVNAVTLSARSSNTGLIPTSGFAFSGSGANRALVITPAPGQVGLATITVSAFDGFNTTTRTFQLFVDERLEYTFLKLPLPTGAYLAEANGMNNAGQVVGFARYQFGPNQPVLWDVSGSVPTVSVLPIDSTSSTEAMAVNDSGVIVGKKIDRPFLYDHGSVTIVNTTDDPTMYDINSGGASLGALAINSNVAFYRAGTLTTNLNGDFALDDNSSSLTPKPLRLNDSGEIAGVSPGGVLTIVRFDNSGVKTTSTPGNFSQSVTLGGLNNAGQVAFIVNSSSQGRGTPVVYDYRRGTFPVPNLFSALATVPGVLTNDTKIFGMNDAGELVGATVQTGLGTNKQSWLYSAGKAYAVQRFVSDPSFVVDNPVAINAAGDILGSGHSGSTLQPFLLRRQWLIAQPLAVPSSAINPATLKAYQAPSVESIDGTPSEQTSSAYVWSDKEQKLYFVRPITVRVTWRTTSNLADTNPPPPIELVGRAVWPTDAQLHISGAPTEILPTDAASPYRALALSYSTIPGAALDPNTKSFSATLLNSTPGYSVIRSVIAPGSPLNGVFNPNDYTNHFQVVKTVPWDSSEVLTSNVPAVVGTPVSDPRGDEVATNSMKSGWVVNYASPYDGLGSTRAYDRDTQTGPIIPVNHDNGTASNALVVAFYKRNPTTGVLWPDLAARFRMTWPTNSEVLVVANPEGAQVSEEDFPERIIYNQPDPTLPGFNPNEEHAFFAPTTSGEGLFALRNDLNGSTTSSNGVLLKYRDASTGEWSFKIYRVALEDATHHFNFAAQAGQEILPPYPLSLFLLCTATNQTRPVIGADNSYRDNRGKFYAKRGPINSSSNPVVVMNYFYQLPSDFYVPSTPPGSCVEWRAIQSNGAVGPVNASFNIRWPDDVPVLEIGETLLDAKHGLPAISSFASARIVYDSLGAALTNGGTRLYDPVSARTLALTNVPGISSSYHFPNDIALETTANGKQTFTKLAYHLRRRLTYDPLTRSLSFSGIIDQTGLGEPLMLVNVISALELQSLLALSSESQFQDIMRALYQLTRNPNGVDLNHDGTADDGLWIGLTMTNGVLAQEPLNSSVKALTAGLPTSSAPTNHYLVIAENDDASLGALPVTLHVIRVGDGPFRGDLKIIFPDNVFDERLTLRHSSDFGGDPSPLQFEWWYHPDAADFDPTDLPQTSGPDGQVIDTRGWRQYRPPASGQHFVTLGEGGESSLFTLMDNWFIVRYRGYNVGGTTNWSTWIGDPASAAETRASFAPGWVKRVIEGINPFEARTTNFHQTAGSTYASMIIQAGERYEGDIALNPSGDNLNSLGLIETYSTVLNRGRQLSIDSATPVDLDPANNALLLAASRISDLYMLLGNEAFADAQDPTIGFFSDSLEFGTVATSIFAFKNQLDSLLDEELTLLRGRDDSAAGVGARPVYNRLLWNFTGAEGEIAYERTYNVGDVNLDGVIDEQDARILFPQGHGDAWGHYLTALTTYYDLLRHPRFTWIPRTETVLIAGVAVQVDFLDERKFASAAALKAKAGAEIVDLTYRSKYVDNPEGQYQGYKDTKPDRAWGVSEWATRTGQAAYFDWVVGNAVLPSTDPNTNHVGIQKIDRQTVSELDEVIAHHREIQAQIDKVDAGLNPLGLAKGVVPFDIDPALLVTARAQGDSGQTHFEQIYNRAVQAMNNTVTMWNQANSLTEALRRQQDDVDDFTANVTDQERDFRNRLIESFGYPYTGDIGAGQTYPSGYDGPDIYHWMYVNTTEITGENSPPTTNFTGFFTPIRSGDAQYSFFPDGSADFFNSFDTTTLETSILPITFPQGANDFAFVAPSSWGSRRAPGEIQQAISDVVQENARLKQALQNYDGLIQQIQDTLAVLQAQHNLTASNINILDKKRNTITGMNAAIGTLKGTQILFRRFSESIKLISESLKEAVPSIVGLAFDVGAPVKGTIKGTGAAASIACDATADGLEIAENSIELSKERVEESAEIELETASGDFEVIQKLAELKGMLRNEAAARLECYNEREAMMQAIGRFQSALAAGQRLLQERIIFRQRTAGAAQQNRYKDAAFRIFRNEALQKYRAQFDLAARYVYLAAAAYDYEVNFLGSDPRGASDFFTDIIRERSLGVMVDGLPITGKSGLSDPLARLKENFEVLAPRFGLNNPQQETARFSLRKELFRIRDESTNQWKALLRQSVVKNLWDVPEFRRYCRPFALESAGAQPGLVIHFPTTINFGFNFFGHPLGGGDSAYDPSLFTTKVNSVGVWFKDYNGAGLATAPRVYLFPAGMDIMRTPTGDTLATREWKIVDQVVPVPFPIGANDLTDPAWIPQLDELSESFAQIRRYSSFRAFHDSGVYDITQTTQDTRLIGRSVWNTDWVLIIPGGTLLANPDDGLDGFIDSVSDILISLQSYSYPGD